MRVGTPLGDEVLELGGTRLGRDPADILDAFLAALPPAIERARRARVATAS